MSVTGGLLDFYILEASEYVDQLDALIGAAVQSPPDSTPFITAPARFVAVRPWPSSCEWRSWQAPSSEWAAVCATAQ